MVLCDAGGCQLIIHNFIFIIIIRHPCIIYTHSVLGLVTADLGSDDTKSQQSDNEFQISLIGIQ